MLFDCLLVGRFQQQKIASGFFFIVNLSSTSVDVDSLVVGEVVNTDGRLRKVVSRM